MQKNLLRNGPVDPQHFPESFCALLIQSNEVIAYSSITGVDQLFFYESEGAYYVTNRHNLLGAVGKSLTLRKKSFEWMVGRTHIGDMSTYWNEITRSKPGEKYTITPYGILKVEPDTRGLFDPIPTSDIRSHITEISSYFKEILSSVSGEKRLWLSGGKDSRAILGLVDCPTVRSDLKLTTGGEYYAPDVMGAQGVSALAGLSDKHSISRPAITSSKMVIAEKVAGDLLIDFTGGSLADLRPISKSNVCIIGGHENGFKAKRNTQELDEYIKGRIYWVDNLNILKNDARDELFAAHKSALYKTLQNVPVSRFGQVDLVNNRNPNFLSSPITNSHVSASEIHPFLDGRMYRLLCGVDDEALESQFIHYAMMYNSEFALESLPFAADNWPVQLYDIAKKLDMPLRNGRSQPYKFNSLFPTLKSFGLYDWRLNLVDGSQKFVRDYIGDNREFFDFISESVFSDLVSKGSKDFAFKEIYTFLSILKACLVHHFGSKILDFSQRESIGNEINDLLDFNRLSGKVEVNKETQMEQENAFLKSKLEDYEKSIAAIVLQHKHDQEAGSSSSAGADSILDSIATEAFGENCDMPLIASITAGMGYNKIGLDGVSVAKRAFKKADKYSLSVDLFMDNAESNNLLVSFESDSGMIPVGFTRSDSGFYFKYISLKNIHGKSVTEISFEGVEIAFEGELKIKPWYSKKPIYFKNPVLEKL